MSWNGRRFLIKSANAPVTSVGVSYKMIEHLHAVLGAFRKRGSTFELYELDPKVCSNNMTPTRSKGPSKNRVGIVRRVFLLNRKDLGTNHSKMKPQRVPERIRACRFASRP